MIMTTYWINISSEYRSFVGQKAVQIAGILHGESAAHFFKIEKGSKELVKVSSVWVVINPGYSLTLSGAVVLKVFLKFKVRAIEPSGF